jgi:hypothetical protein
MIKTVTIMLASPKYPFEEWAVNGAPEDAGLYALYRRNQLLCIGVALGGDDNIRARLLSHFEGGAKARGVDAYEWEIARDPVTARMRYLKSAGTIGNCEDGLGPAGATEP